VRLCEGKGAEVEALLTRNLKNRSEGNVLFMQELLAELYLSRGDLPELRRLPWSQMIADASGTAGNAAAHLSEQDHLHVAARMRLITDLYLSFLTLEGTGRPVARSPALWISNAKGSVFIEQSRLRSERRHPKLAPLFLEMDDINQRLAGRAMGFSWRQQTTTWAWARGWRWPGRTPNGLVLHPRAC
jgi:hypothetical protein